MKVKPNEILDRGANQEITEKKLKLRDPRRGSQLNLDELLD